jgi:hypothetical protein
MAIDISPRTSDNGNAVKNSITTMKWAVEEVEHRKVLLSRKFPWKKWSIES